LPEAWRTAVDDLVRSTTDPGHPWSCSGGTIDLELAPQGALLRVAREGEEVVGRQVATPEDVLPLGQALLAMPLGPSAGVGEHADIMSSSDPMPSPPLASPPDRRDAAPATTAEGAPTASSKSSPRLLLGGGIDARGVGGSNVAWVGPTLSAAVRMGQWLPSISFRQQSAVLFEGPPIDELSVALTVQSRFELSPFELRADSCSAARRCSAICRTGVGAE
jgi:hypothetical protein